MFCLLPVDASHWRHTICAMGCLAIYILSQKMDQKIFGESSHVALDEIIFQINNGIQRSVHDGDAGSFAHNLNSCHVCVCGIWNKFSNNNNITYTKDKWCVMLCTTCVYSDLVWRRPNEPKIHFILMSNIVVGRQTRLEISKTTGTITKGQMEPARLSVVYLLL